MKSKLEYIWLDGYSPTQNLRSKTMVRNDFDGTLESCPQWSFDGSSTRQAGGEDSDCLLQPVAIFPDPDRAHAHLVMCEVLNADGSPHRSNGRSTIDDDDDDFWFGFEQEYFLWDPSTNAPPGFPAGGYPGPQGLYYCSVGALNCHGREIVEEHLDELFLLGEMALDRLQCDRSLKPQGSAVESEVDGGHPARGHLEAEAIPAGRKGQGILGRNGGDQPLVRDLNRLFVLHPALKGATGARKARGWCRHSGTQTIERYTHVRSGDVTRGARRRPAA